MKQILQSYLRRLTNLSATNKSLLLLRLRVDYFIDIHDFNFLLKKPSFDIIRGLMAQKSAIPVCSLADSRDEANNQMSKKLRRLSRTEKYIFEERGSKDLYVGWPFVKGKFSDGTLVRCPLLFFPVDLILHDNVWKIGLRKDVAITFNKSFLLAYVHFNRIRLPEDLIERQLDDLDKDSKAFRTAVYNIIKESPLELNFNQENFIDELHPFKEYKKPEFEQDEQDGVLKLFPEAVLGIFPQAGSYLVPDYNHLLEEDRYEDIEDFFASRTNEDKSIAGDVENPEEPQEEQSEKHSPDFFYFLNKIREEDTFTPYKLDAWQENAIKAVKKGNSLVVQGPPGTGKSQLICNLISDFISRGQRVLLVCQKRAALDVVYERLSANGIAEFAALVHDFRNDRKAIFNKINDQIEKLYDYKMKNSGLDALQMERKFSQASRKIDQITEELEEFKKALFDEADAGISAKELYLKSDRNAPFVSFTQEYREFDYEKVIEFEPKLRAFFAYHREFNREGYTWKERKRFTGYGLQDLKKMKAILRDIPTFQDEISSQIEKLFGAGMDLNEAEKIYEDRENLKEMLRHLKDDQTYALFQHMIKVSDSATGDAPDLLWINTQKRLLLGCFDEPGPEVTLEVEKLGEFQEVLRKKMRARGNIFARVKWHLYSKKENEWVYKVLGSNHLRRKGQDYRKLEKMVDLRLNLEHNITRLRSTKWLANLPDFYLKDIYEQWFDRLRDAVTAYMIFNQYRNFKAYFGTAGLTRKQFTEKVNELYMILKDIPARKKEWEEYFRDARIDMILADHSLSGKMIAALDRDFDALCDFDNLKNDLTTNERTVIEKLLELQEYESEDEFAGVFRNSIWMAWIDHIETKYPVLRSVNSLKFDRMNIELQEAVSEKLQISNEITLLKARERTYEDVEFNRLNNMVTYRDLKHQVEKKKQLWPIRKLVSTFEHELFNLLPCWMASPEAVSAIFPMQQMFDLVIFDEASQCFTEQGIPAMYRGKQVVVTGDKMQLSPFDLYRVRWDEEGGDEADISLEVESLLDLAGAYLMQMQLRGHYRSKSLDLIDFSNRHFYKGGLTLLPDKKVLDEGKPAIDYVKVDGVWSNQTNDAEAEKVIDIIRKIVREEPGKNIGVVTFNARQQDLIMDKLDEAVMAGEMELPEDLFVKNIENVQGDERDIIIFSIAYAPDEKGKMHHHFGTLNIPKGENRLNVAVTRAREKVIVVSSILPQQLKVDDVKNDGPKLLRDYLRYALEVSQGRYKPSLPEIPGHRADWYLKNKLQHLSYGKQVKFELKEEMPFADLTVKSKDQYLGLILTDDDLYYQSVSVKDYHVYTPFTLSDKNWKYTNVFSREYWMDTERVKERIVRFIQ